MLSVLGLARRIPTSSFVEPIVVDLHLQLFVEAVDEFAADAVVQSFARESLVMSSHRVIGPSSASR